MSGECVKDVPMIHMDPWALRVLAGAAHVLLALVVSAHIVLTKQDVRGAIGWVGTRVAHLRRASPCGCR